MVYSKRIALSVLLIFYMSTLQSNWNANYHKHSRWQFQTGKEAVDSFGLMGTERILDVGCGTGRTTYYCAQKLTTGSIVGIDPSVDMIDFAQEEYSSSTNLAFRVCSVTELPFCEEFDVVFSFLCLHWVSDQQIALKNIYNSLNPHGTALLYISIGSPLCGVWQACGTHVAQTHPEWKSCLENYIYYTSQEDWTRMAKDVGFTIADSKLMSRSTIFNQFEDCKKFFKALGIATSLGVEERDRFFDEMLKEFYTKLGLAHHDALEYKVNTIVFTLTK